MDISLQIPDQFDLGPLISALNLEALRQGHSIRGSSDGVDVLLRFSPNGQRLVNVRDLFGTTVPHPASADALDTSEQDEHPNLVLFPTVTHPRAARGTHANQPPTGRVPPRAA